MCFIHSFNRGVATDCMSPLFFISPYFLCALSGPIVSFSLSDRPFSSLLRPWSLSLSFFLSFSLAARQRFEAQRKDLTLAQSLARSHRRIVACLLFALGSGIKDIFCDLTEHEKTYNATHRIRALNRAFLLDKLKYEARRLRPRWQQPQQQQPQLRWLPQGLRPPVGRRGRLLLSLQERRNRRCNSSHGHHRK